MTNEPKDPKVVPGGNVVFEGGTPQADSLDAVVQTAGAGSVDWELDNMDFLAERLIVVLNADLTSAAKSAFPYVIATKQITGQTALAIIPEVKASILRPFLEKEFGTELAQTGIYEATGLHGPANKVSLESLLPYFPEFETLTQLDGRIISFREDPYQALIIFPVEARPFFTGVIRLAGYPQTTNAVSSWYIPITLKDVMAYAKEIGQMGKVKEYMDILHQVKEKNQHP